LHKNISDHTIIGIFDQILNLKLNNTNFNILEFRKLNGERFPWKHPLSHYHLNFVDFNNIDPNILVNMQFSTQNFNNCHLLSNQNLYGKTDIKYIANNFYFYEKKILLTKLVDIKTFNYLNEYNKDIEEHVKNVKNFYKL